MPVKSERAGVVQNRSPPAPASVEESSQSVEGVHHLAEVLQQLDPHAAPMLEPSAVLVQRTRAQSRRSAADGGRPRLGEIQIRKRMDFSRLESESQRVLGAGTVNRAPERRVGGHISELEDEGPPAERLPQ